MRPARGLTLVETVVATTIVAGMFVAALATLGASGVGQASLVERQKGFLLAQGLAAEIVQQSYEEAGGGVFGPDAGEATESRAGFDDVDDYHNWTESPPQNKDGTVIPGLSEWRRSVAVEYVSSADLQQTAGTDQGAKRVTVSVHRGSKRVALLTAVRTRGRDALSR